MFNHSTIKLARQVFGLDEFGAEEPPAPYSIGGSVYKQGFALTVLASGIDTLYLNYTLSPELLALHQNNLETWKLAAQEQNERFRLPLADDLFINPKGNSHYAYVIERPGVGLLLVSYNRLFASWPVRVRLSSDFLSGCSSLDEQTAGGLALVEAVFGAGCSTATQVSEVHVATDFVGYVPSIRDLQTKRFVCPAAPHIEEADADFMLINSMYWGKHGSPVAAVLYNKHKEIREQSEHKRYLLDKWAQAGWSEADGEVFRLEFRFSREWLRECNINAPGDLDLAGLLATGLNWLQLRDCVDGDTNRTRWPLSAVWTDLATQAAALLAGVWRVYKREYVPNVTVDQLTAQIGGCVACVAALVDHDNLYDLFDFARGAYELKLQRQGQSFANEKQKRSDRYMLTSAA